MKKLDGMNESQSAVLPGALAGAINLMAHPLAGAAAFSALGIGLASHAFGIWIGVLSSAAEVSQRMLENGIGAGARSFAPRRFTASQRAETVAQALIADARSVALAHPGTAEAEVSGEPPAGAGREGAMGGASGAAGRPPRSMQRPEAPDDLKAISGIGPKIEKMLNDVGVWRYGQIARWGSEEIAWMDDRLSFNGRIGRDDWVGQARNLAAQGRGTDIFA